MSIVRFHEILRWAQQRHRWPRFEMVMYVNNVTVDEALHVASNSEYADRAHIIQGIESFSGKGVGHASSLGRLRLCLEDK